MCSKVAVIIAAKKDICREIAPNGHNQSRAEKVIEKAVRKVLKVMEKDSRLINLICQKAMEKEEREVRKEEKVDQFGTIIQRVSDTKESVTGVTRLATKPQNAI